MNITTKNRWQVRLIAAIIFALGFTTGILAVNLYRSLARNVTPRDRFEQLSDRLKLNADQKTKVQQIFSDTREQIRTVRQQTDERLQTVLTPEQWQQFQKLRDERGRRGGRGGPRGPGQD